MKTSFLQLFFALFLFIGIFFLLSCSLLLLTYIQHWSPGKAPSWSLLFYIWRVKSIDFLPTILFISIGIAFFRRFRNKENIILSTLLNPILFFCLFFFSYSFFSQWSMEKIPIELSNPKYRLIPEKFHRYEKNTIYFDSVDNNTLKNCLIISDNNETNTFIYAPQLIPNTKEFVFHSKELNKNFSAKPMDPFYSNIFQQPFYFSGLIRGITAINKEFNKLFIENKTAFWWKMLFLILFFYSFWVISCLTPYRLLNALLLLSVISVVLWNSSAFLAWISKMQTDSFFAFLFLPYGGLLIFTVLFYTAGWIISYLKRKKAGAV